MLMNTFTRIEWIVFGINHNDHIAYYLSVINLLEQLFFVFIPTLRSSSPRTRVNFIRPVYPAIIGHGRYKAHHWLMFFATSVYFPYGRPNKRVRRVPDLNVEKKKMFTRFDKRIYRTRPSCISIISLIFGIYMYFTTRESMINTDV